jgi:ATP-dependent DNA helicase HFM1/MER3
MREQVLAQHDIATLAHLRSQEAHRIEQARIRSMRRVLFEFAHSTQLLSRRPPFGREVLSSVMALPSYTLKLDEKRVRGGGSDPLEVELCVQCGLSVDSQPSKQRNTKYHDITNVLTLTSDLDFVDFRRIP